MEKEKKDNQPQQRWFETEALLPEDHATSRWIRNMVAIVGSSVGVFTLFYLGSIVLGGPDPIPEISDQAWRFDEAQHKVQSEAWLKDIRDYKSKGMPARWLTLPKSAKPMVAAVAPAKIMPKRHTKSAPFMAVASDPVAAMFGNADWGDSGSLSFNKAPQKVSANGSDHPQFLGVKVPVRLKGTAASSPRGPVIAVVSRSTQVGDIRLPAGTELHGTANGSTQGARLVMRFSYALINGKDAREISGTAVGKDGRLGVQGKQLMGKGTDVLAGALGGAIQSGGGIAAGLLGVPNPLSAAIHGATGPITSKADRLNYDENVVVAESGASFYVYIEEMGE